MQQGQKTGKPRVLIDARMVGPGGHGIALYVSQLAAGLAKIPNLPYEPFFLLHSSCPKDSLLRSYGHCETELKFLEPAELVGLPKVIRSLSASLYHSTSFASLWNYPCPHLQTVHDLNHLHFGSPLHKLYYRVILLRSLRSARAVLSVSDCAAMEIRSWLQNHGVVRKVGVAPNAIEPFPIGDDARALAHFGLRAGAYFFAVGNPKPHKNIDMLERAYAAALAKDKDLPPLVLNLSGDSGKRVIRTGALAPELLGALLRNATACFSPSLYEGFGRPPVEAALSGTVPVASSLAVHHEVLDGVKEAIMLDPKVEEAWTAQFLVMASFTGRVSEASKEWIRRKWSVEALAGTMDRVYRSCLGL
jgi:glycosyltransferase involved in cell wall biosynthesis